MHFQGILAGKTCIFTTRKWTAKARSHNNQLECVEDMFGGKKCLPVSTWAETGELAMIS